MKTRSFSISGITSVDSSTLLEKRLRKLRGIEAADAHYLSNTVTVTFDEDQIDEDDILKAIEKEGFNTVQSRLAQEDTLVRLVTSLVFTLPLSYFALSQIFGWPLPPFLSGKEHILSYSFLQFLLILPIAIINRTYYRRGFTSLFRLAPNMDSLIALGTGAAISYGIFALFKISHALGTGDHSEITKYAENLYFESAAVILTFITAGKFFEEAAGKRTLEAIKRLRKLKPLTALILRNGKETKINTSDIAEGDSVVIKPGCIIPVDGVITSGNSTLDTSAITGDSIPVEKNIGDQVWAAAVNLSGTFVFTAKNIGNRTALSHIISLVEKASESKPRLAKKIDEISSIFVPAVIVAAIVTALIWLMLGKDGEFALSMSISILVIACPGALGLASPVAVMVGMGVGAKNGILIKKAEAFDIAPKIDTVVLAKTKALTEGKPMVTNILSLCEMDDIELLTIAASIEEPSAHPLSFAIKTEAKRSGITTIPVDSFRPFQGKGIECVIRGVKYLAGGPQLLAENGIDIGPFMEPVQAFTAQGKLPFCFGGEGKPLGIIAVSDIIKPGARDAIASLKEMGIETILVTTDNPLTAEGIQNSAGIDRVFAALAPEGKAEIIQKLKKDGKKIAMIGDGMTDAPSLALADLGIAIGTGTDIAVESADIVLMKGDLRDAVTALRLGKAVMGKIRQNLMLSLMYHMIGIPLAAGILFEALGWRIDPVTAAAAMSISSITVALNALTLNRFRKEFK